MLGAETYLEPAPEISPWPRWRIAIGRVFLAVVGICMLITAFVLALVNRFDYLDLRSQVNANTAKLSQIQIDRGSVPAGSTLLYIDGAWRVVFEASRIYDTNLQFGTSLALTDTIGFEEKFSVMQIVQDIPLQLALTMKSLVDTQIELQILNAAMTPVVAHTLPWTASALATTQKIAVAANVLSTSAAYTITIQPALGQAPADLDEATIDTVNPDNDV